MVSPLPLGIFLLGLEFLSAAGCLTVWVHSVRCLQAECAHLLPLRVILSIQIHALIESSTRFCAWFCGGAIGGGLVDQVLGCAPRGTHNRGHDG